MSIHARELRLRRPLLKQNKYLCKSAPQKNRAAGRSNAGGRLNIKNAVQQSDPKNAALRCDPKIGAEVAFPPGTRLGHCPNRLFLSS